MRFQQNPQRLPCRLGAGAVKAQGVKNSIFDGVIKDIMSKKLWGFVMICYDADKKDPAYQQLEKMLADKIITE